MLALCALAFSSYAAKFTQKLEWRADKNAYEYRVEITPAGGGTATVMTTANNFVELSLPAGEYRYRVFVYDVLGRESSVSDWTRFDILKANTPEIAPSAPEVDLGSDSSTLEMAVTIEDVTADSVVELVNEDTGKTVRGTLVVSGAAKTAGSEVQHATKAQFKNVSAGNWKLRVTNPSGLSSESPAFAVIDQEKIKKETREREKAREKEEKERLALERAAAEEAEKNREKTPEEIAEAKDRVAKKIYNKEVTFSVGGGLSFDIVGEELKEFTDPGLIPAVSARITALPFAFGRSRMGVEFAALAQRRTLQNDYLDAELGIGVGQVTLVFQHSLSQSNRVYGQIRGGGGVSLIQKKVAYLQDAGTRAEPEDTTYLFPMVAGGLTVGFVPVSFLAFEVGVDVSYIIISDMASAMVTPYVALGLRL